jgi:hypothetical protein
MTRVHRTLERGPIIEISCVTASDHCAQPADFLE